MLDERMAQRFFPAHNFAEVRASAFGSGSETASLLRKVGMIDNRQMGIPDHIFEEILEKRLEQLQVKERVARGEITDPHRSAMQLRFEQALRY